MSEVTPARRVTPERWPNATDEELAARVASGDSVAFEDLHERYGESLLGCLRSLLREREDARDALQITMLNAFRALREGRVPEAVRPWLFTIARNAAASIARKRVVHVEIADNDAPPVQGAAETAAERERVELLLGDIREMPNRRRRAVLMRAVQGLEYEEIGGELGISPAAARQATREARLALGEAARGRELGCAEVSTALSLGDARRARSRAFLTHLRTCTSCRRLLPPGSVTRGQVAAILGSILAIRAATARAFGSAACGLASGAAIAKTASVVAIVVSAGSGIAVGLRTERFEPPRARQAAPPAQPLIEQAPVAETEAARPAARPLETWSASAPATESLAAAVQVVAPEPAAGEPTKQDGGAGSSGEAELPITFSGGAPSSGDTPASAGAGDPGAGDSPATPPPREPEDAPGASGAAPGHGATPPGQGGAPPGQSDGSPGASASTPGHGGTPPGQGGIPPGQSDGSPGASASTPVQGGTQPGQDGTPPGQSGTPPGQAGSPPNSGGQGSGAGGSPSGNGGGSSSSGNGNGHGS